MTTVPFDTLKLADRLQAGGFTAEQARAASDALAQALGDGVTADVKSVRADVAALKTDMTVVKWMLGILIAVGIVHSTSLDRSLMPWIIASQTVPMR
jgi:hypothetical protein